MSSSASERRFALASAQAAACSRSSAASCCAAASAAIDPDAVTDDLRITLLRATPTSQTWADGDRRVDCFAVVEDGDTMSRSLLTS